MTARVRRDPCSLASDSLVKEHGNSATVVVRASSSSSSAPAAAATTGGAAAAAADDLKKRSVTFIIFGILDAKRDLGSVYEWPGLQKRFRVRKKCSERVGKVSAVAESENLFLSLYIFFLTWSSNLLSLPLSIFFLTWSSQVEKLMTYSKESQELPPLFHCCRLLAAARVVSLPAAAFESCYTSSLQSSSCSSYKTFQNWNQMLSPLEAVDARWRSSAPLSVISKVVITSRTRQPAGRGARGGGVPRRCRW
jgi:hypothetical protein